MKTLQDFANHLKTVNGGFVRVVDAATWKMVARKIDQPFLDKNHSGDLSKYLNSIKAKHSRVQLEPKKQYGNAEHIAGPSITFDLNGNAPSNTATNNDTRVPPALAGDFGYVKATSDYQTREISKLEKALEEANSDRKILTSKYDDLKEWKRDKKQELKEMERDIKELEEKLAKKNPLSDTMTGLAGSAEGQEMMSTVALKIFDRLMGGNPQPQTPNLAQPAEDLSLTKQKMVENVKVCPDEILQKIYVVLERYNADDSNFIQQFEKLINPETQLKKVQDA